MRYLAIEIKGFVYVMNDQDELGGIIDRDIEHKTLGEVCDDKEYGDNCNTYCPQFCLGTCPATPIRDVHGQLWHVKNGSVIVEEFTECTYPSRQYCNGCPRYVEFNDSCKIISKVKTPKL